MAENSKSLRCSFCGKTETQANQLVSGPDGVHICDECIATCNEMMAQNAIEQVMAGRTSFIIAHRLSTIQSADVILVMKDGHVIEQGNHESLLAKGGFYATLYQSQFAQ